MHDCGGGSARAQRDWSPNSCPTRYQVGLVGRDAGRRSDTGHLGVRPVGQLVAPLRRYATLLAHARPGTKPAQAEEGPWPYMLPTPWLTALSEQWGASCSLLFRISCSGGAIRMTLLASWTSDPGTSPVRRARSGGSTVQAANRPCLSLLLLLRGLKDVADFLTGSALAAGVGLPIILMHTDVVRTPAFPLSVAQS